MNTARKIALIATIVRKEDDGSTGAGTNNNNNNDDGNARNNRVARVVIVDVALEQVLTAQTHIRKGNTTKRRSEEDTTSKLARR